MKLARKVISSFCIFLSTHNSVESGQQKKARATCAHKRPFSPGKQVPQCSCPLFLDIISAILGKDQLTNKKPNKP